MIPGMQSLPARSQWEDKIWSMLGEVAAQAPDRVNLTSGTVEPFADASDLTLVNAEVSGGVCANTVTWTDATTYNTIGAISSTTSNEAGFPSSNVNGGVTMACWLSGSPSIIFTYASAFVLRKYAIGGGSYSYPASAWYLYGSNDQTNWTQLDYRSGQATGGTIVTYTISNTAAFKYYKILGQNLSSSYFQLAWVKLFSSTGNVNAATITLSSVAISGATAGKIIFRAYNADATAALDLGNSGSNKIEVYPMLSGAQGAALACTAEALGGNLYRYTSAEVNLTGESSFGARVQSFARTVAPNFRLESMYQIWR